MEQDRHGLMPIGTFAEASRLSLKALRIYDKQGLLAPEYVDPDSGYRYYAPRQLRSAWLVMRMRRLGMPLGLIQRTLMSDPDAAAELVDEYWRSEERRFSEAKRALGEVRLALQNEEVFMDFVIEQRSLPPIPIASITCRPTLDGLSEAIQGSIRKLRAEVGPGIGPAFTIFHGPVNPESDGPIEVCLPVDEEKNVPGIESKTLPAGPAVSVMLTGDQCDFPAILQAYDALAAWIQTNGHQMAGSPREVYHDEPNETTRPEDRMEIIWPYR